MGVEPDLASSGQEAITMCADKDYDLVLMDIEIPDMDGLAATQILRDTHDADCLPYIVALTANAVAGERDRYLAAGMDDYLSKPIDIERLTSCIHTAAKFRNLT